MITPEIRTISAKKLIGKHLTMSLAQNKTFELWQSFMKQRKEIQNPASTDLYSVDIYDSQLNFKDFTPETEFEKWAAVEVTGFDTIPENMETFELVGGLYAVFLYKGAAKDFAETFRYIFSIWLPNSGYLLDNRPHFALMGEKYKGNDPDSEEEIWIPVKQLTIDN